MSQNTDRGFFHILNQGEDVWLLSELYYGDASLWWVIYHVNLDAFGDDPEYASPGLGVFIPYLEVAESQQSVPDFIAQVVADPSYDPLLLLATDYYGDRILVFDLYEFNLWEADHVPSPGDAIRYFSRASKPEIKKAQRWRSIFCRR